MNEYTARIFVWSENSVETVNLVGLDKIALVELVYSQEQQEPFPGHGTRYWLKRGKTFVRGQCRCGRAIVNARGKHA